MNIISSLQRPGKVEQIGPFNLDTATGLVKENSVFKTAVLRLKIDFVSQLTTQGEKILRPLRTSGSLPYIFFVPVLRHYNMLVTRYSI